MAKSKQQKMQDQFSGMFGGMQELTDQKPQEAPEVTEQPKAKKSTARRPKAVTEPDTKSQKKSDRKSPFSVWLDQKTTADLKLYSAISGEKTTDVVERALTEYMNRHKLTEDQKTAYKQKMMQNLNDI